MASSSHQVVPGSGPSATLNFTDPASVIAIVVALAGVVTAAWPGHNVDAVTKEISLGIAALWPLAVVGFKHFLAGHVAAAHVLAVTPLLDVPSTTLTAVESATAKAAEVLPLPDVAAAQEAVDKAKADQADAEVLRDQAMQEEADALAAADKARTEVAKIKDFLTALQAEPAAEIPPAPALIAAPDQG
jgi:hypothetical protein